MHRVNSDEFPPINYWAERDNFIRPTRQHLKSNRRQPQHPGYGVEPAPLRASRGSSWDMRAYHTNGLGTWKAWAAIKLCHHDASDMFSLWAQFPCLQNKCWTSRALVVPQRPLISKFLCMHLCRPVLASRPAFKPHAPITMHLSGCWQWGQRRWHWFWFSENIWQPFRNLTIKRN